MKSILLVLLALLAYQHELTSQSTGVVTYKYRFNGAEMKERPPLTLQYAANITKLSTQAGTNYTEATYIDYNQRRTYQVLWLNDSRYTWADSFASYNTPKLTDEYDTILGYRCRKATTVVRSNQIEIWFTTETELKGSPQASLGAELGLVLKIVRNGNFETYAESVYNNPGLMETIELPESFGTFVSEAEYRDIMTRQNYTTVHVFTDEKINYGDTIVNPAINTADVTYRFSKGTVLMKKVKLPVLTGDNIIFAELSERSGGDAYDRTGSVFVILPGDEAGMLGGFEKGPKEFPVYKSKTGKEYQGIISGAGYLPPIELMRFITPFGIGSYNEQSKVYGMQWADSVTYKQDVSDLAHLLKGEVWIGVFIGCYDKGGHRVTLDLKYHPYETGQQPKAAPKLWIWPLINTVNLMEASGQEYGTVFLDDTLRVKVNIPAGLKSLKLRYISTGHGGWDGGDEFNQKMNEIFIDGRRVYSYIPWRTDCGSYRQYNPSSGNFPIGVSSSDFSRSGWCPGSTANPVDIPIDISKVTPGEHTLSVFIPMGKPEGTSSSSWNVSAVLVGEMAK